jgi:outer membrane biosynthesis protein TonB
MAHNDHQFPHEARRVETGLRRSLFASLGAHLLLLAFFAGVLFPGFRTPAPPTYTVDLVNPPVAHPRAGRPEAQPHKAPGKPKAKPKPKPEPKPPEMHHREAPAPKVVLPSKPKPAPKPKPKPAPPAKAENQNYQSVVKQIEEMQKEQERQRKIEELKRQLAQLGKDEARPAPVANAPVGMPTGQGDQAGVSYRAWIQKFVKDSWTLSRYQVSSLDLSAKVMLKFNAQGYLFDYNFIDSSGDKRFDDSVKKAFLPLAKTPLPTPPAKELDLEVIFNLKDLKD